MYKNLFKNISQIAGNFSGLMPDEKELAELFKKLEAQYPGQDPWGLDLEYSKKAVKLLYPLYKHYFKVRVYGKENVPDETVVAVSNHSGQIAIDGMLIGLAFTLDIDPPRILRPMIERFMAELPFIAEASFKAGGVLGDRHNCQQLLKKDQSVLVFPEGVRGVSKSTKDFYKLQKFTKGFYRMAIEADKKILPIAVIGAEELYPFVYQAKNLAKMVGLPALPITPFFPWLGVLGAIPLPSPIDIYIGKPIDIPEGLSKNAPDKEINEHIFRVEEEIKEMITNGRAKKRKFVNPEAILKGMK